MAWDDIREYVERDIFIPFTGVVNVDWPLQERDQKVAALAQVDAEISAFATRIGQRIARARSALSASHEVVAPNLQILPWLEAGTGRDEPVIVQLRGRPLEQIFDVSRDLNGTKHEVSFNAATFYVSAASRYQLKPITIDIESIELEEGSLRAKVTGVIKVTVVTLTFLFAAMSTPVATDIYRDVKFEQVVERTIEGQKCETKANWTIELGGLKDVNADSFNFEQEGISEAERTLRICKVQLALAVAQRSPAKIDGIFGQNTRAALKTYASNHGVPPDIRSEVLRGFLAGELTLPSQRNP